MHVHSDTVGGGVCHCAACCGTISAKGALVSALTAASDMLAPDQEKCGCGAIACVTCRTRSGQSALLRSHASAITRGRLTVVDA